MLLLYIIKLAEKTRLLGWPTKNETLEVKRRLCGIFPYFFLNFDGSLKI